jgi:NAD+ synthase
MSGVNLEELLQWTEETVAETGQDGVVLGLSGGVDSSTTATILTRALGKDNVKGLIMPIKSNPDDAKYGRWIADELGIDYDVVDLNATWHTFLQALDVKDKQSLGSANTKARLRMCALYQQANDYNYLVSGTANKSETWLGYATLHGDSACDFAPIAHLYKTEVYELAKNHLDEVPDEIVEKPPSAGLWKGQTDENELGMNYEVIDRILQSIESTVGLDNFAEFDPETDNEKQVIEYMKDSVYKRNPVKTFS